MTLLRRLIAAIGVAFIVVLGTGTMAAASESGGDVMASGQPNLDPESAYEEADGASGNACGVGGGDSDINEAQDLLPVNRWSSIVSHFPRNPDSGITNLDVLVGETSTQMFGGLVFGLSSAMWSMNTSITSMAINFCPIDVIGGQIDNFVGTLGTVILTGGAPLIAAVGAIVIISVLWQMRRGTLAPLKQIAVKGAAIGALAVMTMGAANSWTDGNQHQDAQWDPPWYSPGGLIVEMNNAASGISSGSIEWIMGAMFEETGALVPQDERHGSAHCHWMIESGHNEYQEVVGSGAGLVSGLSQTWVGTTYDAWTRALFGDEYSVSNSDPARDLPHYYIPCRIAEWHADIPNSASDLNDSGSDATPRVAKNHYLNNAFILAGAMPEGQYLSDGTFSPQNTGSAPAITINNNNDLYWSLVAGMCFDPSFDGDGGMEAATTAELNHEFSRVWHGNSSGPSGGLRSMLDRHNEDGNDAATAVCGDFWTHTGPSDENAINDGDGFQVHGSRSNIVDGFGSNSYNDDWGFADSQTDGYPSAAGQVAMVNFMTSANVGGVTFEGIGSMIASISVLILMIPILIVLSLVRLLMVMMMIGLFLSLLMALSPKQNFEAFTKTLKMTIGIILLSIFIQVIFAVIMGIMLMLNDMGAEVLGTGGITYAFWTAVTPWLAALGVHLTFKFLKLPSPLKLGSAMEWGNAMAKQGADSMGAKAGSVTGGGGAGEKSQDMADKLRKRKSGTDGSDSRGSGSDRQAGQEQTEGRKGSQRGVLAKMGAGAAAMGGKAKSRASKEIGGTEATAAAREDVKGIRGKIADMKKDKKAAQRKELDHAKDTAWAKKKELSKQAKGHKKTINALSGKESLNEDEQVALQRAQAGLADVNDAKKATAAGVKAMKKGQKDELNNITDQGKTETSDAKSSARGARTAAIKENWAARKAALAGAAATAGSWANDRRKRLGLQTGLEGKQQRRDSLRAMGQGLKSGANAVGSGMSSGARALPGAALRAAAGANKSEDLTTKQLAGRAARNAAVVGGIGGTAMLGGAPIAAMGGAALLGGGALGARRAWNTMTSKNEGSVRSRVGDSAASVRDSLSGAGRDPAVSPESGSDSGGAGTPPPDGNPGDDQTPPEGPASGPSGGGGSTPVPPTPVGGSGVNPTEPSDGSSGGPNTDSSASTRDSSHRAEGIDPRAGAWQPEDDQAPPANDEAPASADEPERQDNEPPSEAADVPQTSTGQDQAESVPEQQPDAVDVAAERMQRSRDTFGGVAASALSGAAAASRATERLGGAVEDFSPVDDQATVDSQREEKSTREALGDKEKIPGYNAPADDPSSREFSLEEKGGPPPMPPESEPGQFNDGSDVHRSGEDFAERMRRLKGRDR